MRRLTTRTLLLLLLATGALAIAACAISLGAATLQTKERPLRTALDEEGTLGQPGVRLLDVEYQQRIIRYRERINVSAELGVPWVEPQSGPSNASAFPAAVANPPALMHSHLKNKIVHGGSSGAPLPKTGVLPKEGNTGIEWKDST